MVHHYKFLSGSIDEDADEFHIRLFNSETKGEVTVSGSFSKTFRAHEGEPHVERVGHAMAHAMNELSRDAGGALA
jgi:hypothetical protein